MINGLVFQVYDKENKHIEISVVDKLTFKVGESEIEMSKNL